MDILSSLFAQADILIVALIFVLGIVAFILSTISGGGGGLVLVPVFNWLIGVSQTAPVLNFTMHQLPLWGQGWVRGYSRVVGLSGCKLEWVCFLLAPFGNSNLARKRSHSMSNHGILYPLACWYLCWVQ